MPGGGLVVLDRQGEDVKRYSLPEGMATLGSDVTCDIRVLLPSVSGHHATVVVRSAQTVIRNVSERETLVNGRPVSVAALQHGDIITLGDRSLRWEYDVPDAVRQPVSLPTLVVKKVGKQRGRARKRMSDVRPRQVDPAVQLMVELNHRLSMPANGGGKQVAVVQPQRRDNYDNIDTTPRLIVKPHRPYAQANKRRSYSKPDSPKHDNNASIPEQPHGSKRKTFTSKIPVKTPVLQNTTKATLWIESRKRSPRKSTWDGKTRKTLTPNVTFVATQATKTPISRRASASANRPTNLTSVATQATKTPISRRASASANRPTNLTSVATQATKTPISRRASASANRPTNLTSVATQAKKTPVARVAKIQAPSTIDQTKQAALMLITGHTAKSKTTSPKEAGKPSPKKTTKSNHNNPKSGKLARSQIAQRVSSRISKGLATSAAVTPNSKRSSKSYSPNQTVSFLDISERSLPVPRKSSMKDPKAKKGARKTESITFDLTNLDNYKDDSADVRFLSNNSTREGVHLSNSTDVSDLALHFSDSSHCDSPSIPIHSRSSKTFEKSLEDIAETNCENDCLTPKSLSARRSIRGSVPIHSRSSKTFEKSLEDIAETNCENDCLTPKSLSARRSIRGSVPIHSRSSKTFEKSLEDIAETNCENDCLTPKSLSARKSIRGFLVRQENLDKNNSPRYSNIITRSKPDQNSAIVNMTKTLSPRSPKNMESYSVVDLVSNDSNESRSSVYNTVGSESTAYGTPKTSARKTRSTIEPTLLGSSTPYVLEIPEKNINSTRLSRASRRTSNDSEIPILSTNEGRSTKTSKRSSKVTSFTSIAESPSLLSRKSPIKISESFDYNNLSLSTKRSKSLSTAAKESNTFSSKRSSSLPTPKNAKRSLSINSTRFSKASRRTHNDSEIVILSTSEGRRSSRSASYISITESPSLLSRKSPIKISESFDYNNLSLSTKRSKSLSTAAKKSNTFSSKRSSSLPTPKNAKRSLSINSTRFSKASRRTHNDSEIVILSTSEGRRSSRSASYKSITESPSLLNRKSATKSTKDVKSLRVSTTTSPRDSKSPRVLVSRVSPKLSISKANKSQKISSSKKTAKNSSRTETSLVVPGSPIGDGLHTPDNTHSPQDQGTPVLSFQSLLSSSDLSMHIQNRNKITRILKDIRIDHLHERRTIGERTVRSEPRRGRSGILPSSVDAVINGSYLMAEDICNAVMTRKHTSKPSNEKTITPKSTMKLTPVAVKEKHSTAKKPLSKRSLIDNLNESDIVKSLFNSPVKRKLSQSMTEFSRTQLFEEDLESRTARKSSRKHNVSTGTLNHLNSFEALPQQEFGTILTTPGNSPNVSVQESLLRNNDLVKSLFQTSTTTSPKNDLRDVRGVKRLFTRDKSNDGLNDLSGVEELFDTSFDSHKNSPRNQSALQKSKNSTQSLTVPKASTSIGHKSINKYITSPKSRELANLATDTVEGNASVRTSRTRISPIIKNKSASQSRSENTPPIKKMVLIHSTPVKGKLNETANGTLALGRVSPIICQEEVSVKISRQAPALVQSKPTTSDVTLLKCSPPNKSVRATRRNKLVAVQKISDTEEPKANEKEENKSKKGGRNAKESQTVIIGSSPEKEASPKANTQKRTTRNTKKYENENPGGQNMEDCMKVKRTRGRAKQIEQESPAPKRTRRPHNNANPSTPQAKQTRAKVPKGSVIEPLKTNITDQQTSNEQKKSRRPLTYPINGPITEQIQNTEQDENKSNLKTGRIAAAQVAKKEGLKRKANMTEVEIPRKTRRGGNTEPVETTTEIAEIINIQGGSQKRSPTVSEIQTRRSQYEKRRGKKAQEDIVEPIPTGSNEKNEPAPSTVATELTAQAKSPVLPAPSARQIRAARKVAREQAKRTAASPVQPINSARPTRAASKAQAKRTAASPGLPVNSARPTRAASKAQAKRTAASPGLPVNSARPTRAASKAQAKRTAASPGLPVNSARPTRAASKAQAKRTAASPGLPVNSARPTRAASKAQAKRTAASPGLPVNSARPTRAASKAQAKRTAASPGLPVDSARPTRAASKVGPQSERTAGSPVQPIRSARAKRAASKASVMAR